MKWKKKHIQLNISICNLCFQKAYFSDMASNIYYFFSPSDSIRVFNPTQTIHLFKGRVKEKSDSKSSENWQRF